MWRPGRGRGRVEADPRGGSGSAATGRSVRVEDVFGVPTLPPAPVTSATNRLRAGLARLLRGTAPPPVRILEGLFGVLDLSALVALCRAGVPDRLTGRVPVSALASELGADPERLTRLLRFAAARGWVRMDRHGRVGPTRVIAFLRTDHPGGWRAWVEFMGGEEILGALGRLEVGLPAGGDPFAAASGEPFFDWMTSHPLRHATFDAAMAAGGRMHGLVLGRALDWSSSHRVCDIGGGTGALLTTLLGAHRHLEGVLLELPEVAARAPDGGDRLTVIGGDAFDAVPGGCDTYLLVNVLHDWADADADRLLRNVARAMTDTVGGGAHPPSRVVVVEGRAHERPRDDLSARTDLLMFALTAGGRERTTAEFADLAGAAGLQLDRTVPLLSGDVAHVLTRPGTPT